MESIRAFLHQHLISAWRRRWYGVAAAWIICGVGWASIYAMPNQFESNARLYVDADAVLTPLLKGLVADSAPVSQLDVLQRTLLSGPNLEKLIGKTDLDLSIIRPGDRESLVQRLQANIKVVSQTRNLFTISYRNPNPKLAYDVVRTLLTIFIESATGGNRNDMDNARRFLEHQISSYEQQLRAAERRRADFRSKYMDILPPDGGGGGTTAVEAARSNARQIEGQFIDSKMKRDALKQELANTPQLLVVEHGSAGGGGGGQSRLAQAVQELNDLRLRLTDAHPDVIAQRKRIADMKINGSGGSSTGTGPVARGDGKDRSLPNPVYDQVKIRLVEAESQVASLERQADDALKYREKIEKIQREQPGLAAEYQNLDRDYNVLRKNYEELLSRLQSANIAQAADTQADQVKLQIVDPPQVSRLPVAPNRLLLIPAILLVGLGAGIAVPIGMAQLDRSFTTVEELRSIGFPVLGGISLLISVSRRVRILTALRFSLAVVLLVAVFGGIVAQLLRSSASI